jgi:uncharacterized membrane protein YfcA
LLPVGILGVIQYYKQGYLNVNYVIIISIAFVLGSFLGGKLALSLSDEKMKKIFAIVMMLIAIKMLFFDTGKPAAPKDPVVSSTKNQQTGH